MPDAISVVIPAHNEAAVLGRLLGQLRDVDPDLVEIVVVPNGCSDATAAVASSYPGVTVVETTAAGKSHALNLGDSRARSFPRFYVDADIEVTGSALLAVADDMTATGRPAGAPRPRFDTSRAGWLSRKFYAHYETTSYLRSAVLGLGVYGLTEAGRARFEVFPDATGDDLFVASLFAPDERAGFEAGTFMVHVPATASSLLRVRSRVYLGNWQGETTFGRGHSAAEPSTESLRTLAHADDRGAAAIYYSLNATAKVIALRQRRRLDTVRWARDDSSRR